MSCTSCKRDVPLEFRDEEAQVFLCASCNKKRRNVDEDLYPAVKRMFLKKMVDLEAVCPIKGTPITMDSDVHHMKSRSSDSYADQWAIDNDISLLIDPRFFLACSREGHQWIELHPKEAKRLGYSVSRNDII